MKLRMFFWVAIPDLPLRDTTGTFQFADPYSGMVLDRRVRLAAECQTGEFLFLEYLASATR